MIHQWSCFPEVSAYLLDQIERFKGKNSDIASFERELRLKTSTKLFDWIDHIVLEADLIDEKKLLEFGFSSQLKNFNYEVFAHGKAKFPRVVLKKQGSIPLGIAIRVDRIEDALLMRGVGGKIEGAPFSAFRRAMISEKNDAALMVVERRTDKTLEPIKEPSGYLERYFDYREKWTLRPRQILSENEAFDEALTRAQEMVQALGKDIAASIILEVEREFWQAKNRAGREQKARQDQLGLGWGNHDHHTFRSSRTHFTKLVKLFEIVGFEIRERFYAGQEAGWGAQIMEHKGGDWVLFLDVDLTPDEVTIDFAHMPLDARPDLGTVGLWCALHGDSILGGGMHHLEAQFQFDQLHDDLKELGIAMMAPFTDLTYLKQAFTKGERWPVDPQRVDQLLKEGKISSEDAARFLKEGAIGSHLENLERHFGYKGFNPKGVSAIIKKTDPRLVGA